MHLTSSRWLLFFSLLVIAPPSIAPASVSAPRHPSPALLDQILREQATITKPSPSHHQAITKPSPSLDRENVAPSLLPEVS